MSGVSGFAAVAVGGALGACARYSLSLWLAESSVRFPYATLTANLTGAFLAGFIVTLLLSRGVLAAPVYLLLVTGFLGSFTTLSAFSIETVRLVQSGAVLTAMMYVLVSIAGALLMVLAGSSLVRLLNNPG